MKLSTNNFFAAVKSLVMGGGLNASGEPYNDAGYRVTKPLNLPADLRTAAGLTLTGATVPAVLLTETNGMTVAVASSQTAAGSFQFTVPTDYDEATDEFKIRVIAGMDGATDVPTMTATIYRKRVPGALSANLPPVASAALGTSADWREIDASGLGLRAGDSLTINLVTGAHTTNAVSLHAVELVYRSTLVSYNEFASDNVTSLR